MIVNEPRPSHLRFDVISDVECVVLESAIPAISQPMSIIFRRTCTATAPYYSAVSISLSRSTNLSISVAWSDTIISVDQELINYITLVPQLPTKDTATIGGFYNMYRHGVDGVCNSINFCLTNLELCIIDIPVQVSSSIITLQCAAPPTYRVDKNGLHVF